MAIFQAGTGYRDPTKAMSVKALQQRMKAAQEASLMAQQPQAPIPSNMAGLAHLAGVAATGFRENQAMGQEADARGRLAQVMAGIDPNAGPSPDQMAQINMLDPDMGATMYENAMKARQEAMAREDAQAHDLEMQGGQQTFTGEQNELTRQAEADRQSGQQTFTAGQNEENRAAEEARQAALFGHQDTSAKTLAETNAAATNQEDALGDQNRLDEARIADEKAANAQRIKEGAIGAESAAKVAEAKRLGLSPGSPEYQKFVFDISPTADTNITTNVGGGKKLDETLDLEEGKIWSGHQKERNLAAGSQKDMSMLSELVKMAPQGPIIGTLASVPILKNFSNAGVAFSSIVKRVAPTLRVEGSGSTSDLEYNGMLESLPVLANYPEANALIIGMMQAKSAINIERGNAVDAYRNGIKTDIETRNALAEINSRSITSPELEALFETIRGGGGTGTGEAPAESGGSWTVKEVP